MRSLVLLVLLLFGSQLLTAADPEPIYPITRRLHSLDYYQTQVAAWYRVVTARPSEARAWQHYYTAARNANLLGADPAYDLTAILTEVQSAVPESFEALYLEFWRQPFDAKDWTLVERAHERYPQRTEVLHDLSTHGEITGDDLLRDTMLQRLYHMNPEPTGILEWNYNALNSVAPDAILLTQADNDTHPAWTLQAVHGIRTDVQVLNLYVLYAYPAYRERKLREVGVDPTPLQTVTGLALFKRQLIQALLTQEDRPVYACVTMGAEVAVGVGAQSGLTGLAFRLSRSDTDPANELVTNFQQRWRLDYLRLPLPDDPSVSVVDEMNGNYLPAFLKVHGYYRATGQPTRAEAVRDLILLLSRRNGTQHQVATLLAAPARLSSADPGLTPRQLEKQLAYVPSGKLRTSAGDSVLVPGFFMGETEVSNAQYQLFLEDLLRQRDFERMQLAKVHDTDWRGYLPEEDRSRSVAELFENGRPTDGDHPVANLSRAAAELYCAWLTDAYNSSERPKNYRRVWFRLPTPEEWRWAAQGGRSLSPYPWGGPYLKNSKGCFLANFNPAIPWTIPGRLDYAGNITDPTPGPITLRDDMNADGAYFTTKVDAYFPNDYGLYHMSGNVAEIVSGPDIILGGGWLDSAPQLKIDATTDRQAPDPSVGFRILMTVIED